MTRPPQQPNGPAGSNHLSAREYCHQRRNGRALVDRFEFAPRTNQSAAHRRHGGVGQERAQRPYELHDLAVVRVQAILRSQERKGLSAAKAAQNRPAITRTLHSAPAQTGRSTSDVIRNPARSGPLRPGPAPFIQHRPGCFITDKPLLQWLSLRAHSEPSRSGAERVRSVDPTARGT